MKIEHTPVIASVNGYRMLQPGEVLQEGDEFRLGSAWAATGEAGKTLKNTAWDRGYRRKVDVVAPQSRKTLTADDIKAGQVYRYASGAEVTVFRSLQYLDGDLVLAYVTGWDGGATVPASKSLPRISSHPEKHGSLGTRQSIAEELNNREAVLIGTFQTHIVLDVPSAPPIPRTRKVTAADVKAGAIFGWGNGNHPGPNIQLATGRGHLGETHILSVGLAGFYADRGSIVDGTYSRTTEITALYPNARFDFGAPQTEIKGEVKKEPLTRNGASLRKGDVFQSPTYYGNAIFYACHDVDGEWEQIHARVLRENTTPAHPIAQPHIKIGKVVSTTAGSFELPLLDPKTFEPLVRDVNTTRKVTGADVKPGDVFAYRVDRWDGTPGEWRHHVCTRIEDQRVYGVSLYGTAYESYVCDTATAANGGSTHIALFPDAKLILGNAVTELPAE